MGDGPERNLALRLTENGQIPPLASPILYVLFQVLTKRFCHSRTIHSLIRVKIACEEG